MNPILVLTALLFGLALLVAAQSPGYMHSTAVPSQPGPVTLFHGVDQFGTPKR